MAKRNSREDAASLAELKAINTAINRVQAVIEFSLDGTILDANENFLKAMGYTREEVVGKHHSMFVDAGYAKSEEYQDFWHKLRAGEVFADHFRRIAKGGREVWIEASYNPVLDAHGKPYKVIKFATDITRQEVEFNELKAIKNALSRTTAVIEFDLQGNILTANENFLKSMGYTLEEVVGKHHSMFVDADYAKSQEYKDFWEKLRRGEFFADRFRRIAKGGREVWLDASYNPLFDLNGKPYKVAKFATDVTERANLTNELQAKESAISRAQAVIEFKMDGTILTANQKFLDVMGYTLEEIVGKHHSMFADPEYAASAEYQQFWERLRNGEFFSDKYHRLGKGGRDVWIQASYNPLFDLNGKPMKVVKFASDVTERELNRRKMEAMREERSTAVEQVVSHMGEGLQRLAEGNLTIELDEKFAGEFEPLRQNYNTALKQLKDTIGTVTSCVGTIFSNSRSLSQGADKLSQRTEQQAAGIEESAAALEEIAATMRRSTENIKVVTETASSAHTAAGNGRKIVQTTISAMENIAQSSSQIADTISVIDEIAFQTNLLALNAGVEAARAGEAGRGFAVVAQEVRALAGRSAEAAREIKGMIRTSREYVSAGVKHVGESGNALKDIEEKIYKIDGLIQEMAQALEQQSEGVGEVNSAINVMDKSTQENSAMVEESTAATQALAQEASALQSLMSVFRCKDD